MSRRAERMRPRGLSGRSTPHRLSDVSVEAEDRIPVPIGEFARVLGGGLVPGSIVLVGGDPGIGKSTLMLQVALEMATRLRVLYVSGEEFERQIKMRAKRIACRSKIPGRPVPRHRDQPGDDLRTRGGRSSRTC